MGRQGHPVNRHETSAGSTLCARYSGAAPRACNAPLRCNAQRPRQLCVSLLFAAHASGCGRAFASGRGACARDYPLFKNESKRRQVRIGASARIRADLGARDFNARKLSESGMPASQRLFCDARAPQSAAGRSGRGESRAFFRRYDAARERRPGTVAERKHGDFDEAHQLPDTATLFFGETVRSYQWVELARDVRIEGLTHARDGADWTALCAALETAARDLRLAFDERAAKYAFAQLDADHPLHAALAALDAPLDALTAALEAHAPRAETLGQCLRRTHELRAALARFRAPYPVLSTAPSAAPDRVRWVEVFAQSVHLHTTPLSITAFFE